MRDLIAGFWVTDTEAKLLRELVRAPQKTGGPPRFGMWERIPDGDLKQLPDEVLSKMPKFKGLRYTIDPNNNAIALAEPSGIVVAII